LGYKALIPCDQGYKRLGIKFRFRFWLGVNFSLTLRSAFIYGILLTYGIEISLKDAKHII